MSCLPFHSLHILVSHSSFTSSSFQSGCLLLVSFRVAIVSCLIGCPRQHDLPLCNLMCAYLLWSPFRCPFPLFHSGLFFPQNISSLECMETNANYVLTYSFPYSYLDFKVSLVAACGPCQLTADYTTLPPPAPPPS